LRHAAGAVAGRTLATPEPNWSLTSLKDKLIKMGAKVVSHGRYVVFQNGGGHPPSRIWASSQFRKRLPT
jgi:hypothetical protein